MAHAKKLIYLDYAAATPVDPDVLAAMLPYYRERFFNPSAPYLAAKQVANELQNARASVAHWFGAKPSEVIFTAGGTEANNLAIRGIMEQYPQANLVISAIEHESVMAPARLYAYREANVDANGLVDLADIRRKIDEKTVLISIMYANNEVGTVQPLKEVTALAHAVREERRKKGNSLPLYVHTDACQAPAYLDIHAARLGVDMITINGGKIYGPKQSGALFVRSGLVLKPLVLGGGQELGRRSGTENVAQSVGLARALDRVQQRRKEEVTRLKEVQRYFVQKLAEALPRVRINGSLKKRLPNNIHITVAGTDNERLIVQLEAAGILCAAGSACSASSDEPSHVLRAMGLSESEARSSLRFSMGASTDKAAIDRTVAALAAVAGGS